MLKQIDFKGVEETQKKLMRIAKQINDRTENTLQTVAQLGFNYARNLAPEYTGALKAAMLYFKENKNIWVIISKRPVGDKIPINLLFDLGIYPNPRRKSSLGFMKQTEEFLRKEFSERLNIEVSRSIQENDAK